MKCGNRSPLPAIVMKKVDFRKYSLNGNAFVILDETGGEVLTESEKSRFASLATDINFGIGADNFILIQDCSEENLLKINRARGYWSKTPDCGEADFIFRMFEPSGEEAFCCGNGLMCISDHLARVSGRRSWKIMTEVPMEPPRVVTVGLDEGSRMNWANLGVPRPLPSSIMTLSSAPPFGSGISRIENLSVVLQDSRFDRTGKERLLKISGYMVFTGEPHFVIFTNSGLSIGDISNDMFAAENHEASSLTEGRRRGNYSTWLVHHIGMYFNQTDRSLFPQGVNLTFVRIVDSRSTLEYRSFERGINHETLACGTGAVAASVVSRELGLCTSDDILVWPHRCRWYSPQTQYTVRRENSEWFIYGTPRMLYEGSFSFD